jgi:hypothetical protein
MKRGRFSEEKAEAIIDASPSHCVCLLGHARACPTGKSLRVFAILSSPSRKNKSPCDL